MKKAALLATALLASSVAYAESGSGQGTITIPLNAGVGNVCTWWDQPTTDIAGNNFTQTDRGDGETPVFSGTYYATKDLVGAAQVRIKCTKGTTVKRSFDSTLKLTRSGSNDYLLVNVSEGRADVLSAGGDAQHSVPDQFVSNMTFTAKAGQWGVSKGTYSGKFVMTYDYQ